MCSKVQIENIMSMLLMTKYTTTRNNKKAQNAPNFQEQHRLHTSIIIINHNGTFYTNDEEPLLHLHLHLLPFVQQLLSGVAPLCISGYVVETANTISTFILHTLLKK